MSDAYVAYVRCGERVLIMQRADEVADFPGSWDGVYGIGDPDDVDAVAVRITECTGIPTEDLQHVRSGAARGLAFGNRLDLVLVNLDAVCACAEHIPNHEHNAADYRHDGTKSHCVPRV